MVADTARERERRRIDQRLAELDTERQALESARAALCGRRVEQGSTSSALTQQAAPQEKVLLFRSLFRGRTDVYPLRWENKSSHKSGYAPACSNEWVRGVCEKPRIKCGDCTNRAFVAVSDGVIEKHLRGDIVAGVYPLSPGNTCNFVAVDFDGEGWIDDSLAFVRACSAHHVPVARERSRSGAGAHAWIFFKDATSASQARQLATALISAAMDQRAEIGFGSYDRLFPSQDLMPHGGFGNLIALPLQREAREHGHSVFIDDAHNPFPDQWAYLASVQMVEAPALESLLRELVSSQNGATRIRLPTNDEDSPTPWALPAAGKPSSPVTEPLPKRVIVTLADQIYIDRTALPASMVTRLMRLAAFQNPEFYQAQAMRFPTFDKPRVISCAALHPHHLELPRGCLEDAKDLLASSGVQIILSDERQAGDLLGKL